MDPGCFCFDRQCGAERCIPLCLILELSWWPRFGSVPHHLLRRQSRFASSLTLLLHEASYRYDPSMLLIPLRHSRDAFSTYRQSSRHFWCISLRGAAHSIPVRRHPRCCVSAVFRLSSCMFAQLICRCDANHLILVCLFIQL